MKNWLPLVSCPALAMAHHTGLIEFQVAIFIDERVSRSAHAGTTGVSALGHEAGQHAVEGHAVEVPLPGQEHEAVDRDGGLVGIKLDDELAAFGHLYGGTSSSCRCRSAAAARKNRSWCRPG